MVKKNFIPENNTLDTLWCDITDYSGKRFFSSVFRRTLDTSRVHNTHDPVHSALSSVVGEKNAKKSRRRDGPEGDFGYAHSAN